MSMTDIAWLDAEVSDITPLAHTIRQFTLRVRQGVYPHFTSGSHLLVRIAERFGGAVNAYSLLDAHGGGATVRIAVRREPQSRRGSAWMHTLQPGDAIRISTPSNLFALDPRAGRHVFVAGGIGITPFIAHLAHLEALRGQETACHLHYAFRSAADAAFCAGLAARGNVSLYDAARGQRIDLGQLLATLDDADHLYVCGPRRMIDEIEAKAAGERLRVERRLHVEQFAQPVPVPGAAFTVRLVRSGCEVVVAEDESILDAIERRSPVKVQSLCREGYCGTCEARLLSGSAEHRDQYLSEDERRAQDRIMLCVSRAACATLELDL